MFIKTTHFFNDKEQCFYHKEEDVKIIGNFGDLGVRIQYKVGGKVEEMDVINLEYPISTTTNIDAVTVNQSTDISGLTSALDKMNETLEKVLDKLS